MDTELVKLLSWAIVEIEAHRPDTTMLKQALEAALGRALQDEHTAEKRKSALARMMNVLGV